ncbi:sensor histidine kinase [Leptothoe spongobia]|uniref:histidine kinase n=1 Tax=Leptothoe spongobia TAU-MAC 1115 TaxID=1967444 RepID=A0A947DHG0_9CYAN|nr:response regulator [Leptothoe spongobia]MBT9316981.1 hybrid sensor histidine kinase/response regulator [Leptothoe spongobia TAU-MAC 1115]
MQITDAEILVVDDTPANLKVVTETLASAGYRVAIATSGERALKQLQNRVPALILLDIQMPGINGFETCKKIKENPELYRIPIIFLTARSDTDSTLKGFELGAVDYISKPFKEPELLARVKIHLQLQQMTQTLEQQVSERTQALSSALTELQRYQLQLIQHEKMSALGNLVAGIGHEINNPLGFVDGNILVLKEYFDDFLTYLRLYEQTYPPSNEVLSSKRRELDIDYLLTDIDTIFESMTKGCDLIRDVSKSIRIFSRTDTAAKLTSNLHEGLDSTLHILKYRLKAKDSRPAIQVIRDYSELPDIKCFPGQLNQAFMNILANAIDMFEEVAENTDYATLETNPQSIIVRTRLVQHQETESVEITITDNGKGISEDVCSQIFERNFTTKSVGKGTGLGLAIAHQVIVEKHGGSLNVQSELDQGTTFQIYLPTMD